MSKEFDFFWEEPGAPAYFQAAWDAMDKGQPGIHPHTAFELAVDNQVPSKLSTMLCFQARNRVKETKRELAYGGPENVLPEGWIDEL